MNTYIAAFIATFVGSVLASLFVVWLDRRFRLPAASAEAPLQQFPEPIKLLSASMFVFGAWLCLGLFLLQILSWSTGLWRSEALALGSLCGFLGFTIAYASLAFLIRCPKCQNHVLVQWTTRPPYSKSKFGMDGWATLAMSVAFERKFCCMYCGQRFIVGNEPHSPRQA